MVLNVQYSNKGLDVELVMIQSLARGTVLWLFVAMYFVDFFQMLLT